MNPKLKQALKTWHDAEVRLNHFESGILAARKGQCERARDTARTKLLQITREVLKLKTTLAVLFVLFAAFCSQAVQPPTGGVFEMVWSPIAVTNPVDYCVWETTNNGARWRVIGETRGTTFAWTNRTINPMTHFYAVTAMPWVPFGTRAETEMKLLHWAPSGNVTNATGLVKLRAVETPNGQRIKLSSDLAKWDDWLTVRAFDGTNELTNATVCLEHSTSPDKPRLFYGYTVITNPPPLPP